MLTIIDGGSTKPSGEYKHYNIAFAEMEKCDATKDLKDYANSSYRDYKVKCFNALVEMTGGTEYFSKRTTFGYVDVTWQSDNSDGGVWRDWYAPKYSFYCESDGLYRRVAAFRKKAGLGPLATPDDILEAAKRLNVPIVKYVRHNDLSGVYSVA